MVFCHYFSFYYKNPLVGGSVEKHCIICIISLSPSSPPPLHGAVENVSGILSYILFYFYKLGFLSFQVGHVALVSLE